MKWEYITIYLAKEITPDNILNTYGDFGWELVNVDDRVAYFKRPKRSKKTEEVFVQAIVDRWNDLITGDDAPTG